MMEETGCGANMQHNPPAVWHICLFVFCLTLALTAGRGLVRFRHVLGATGQQFIDLNHYDALVHVTIAQRILNGRGYTLPRDDRDGPPGESEPAFGKAPGYEYFLAGLFRITGICFSFFPVQCLIGGCLSVLVVLISAETFGDPLAALFAGVGAAVHPVLVNAASQLYNENIYFCLLFLCIWVYMRWLRTPSLGLALACGCCAGVTALVRESILVPFAALVLWTVVSAWHKNRLAASGSAIAMAIGLTAIVMPWTIRNYLTSGELVPISTASLFLVGAGNNSCVAAEGWGTPFYGDDPCASLDAQQAALLASWNKGTQIVYRSRAEAALGWSYILGHPGQYLKLSVRRAWTMFDPWHPRQHLRGWEKWAMLLYFLVFIAPGVVGAAWVAMRGAPSQAKALYVLLLASYAPLVAVFISHDHRFAVGIHLLLGCFAGAWLAHFPFARGVFRASRLGAQKPRHLEHAAGHIRSALLVQC
jgi:4-amino-4-deoxy-L-arabinose transferase-like glycosyltransferase